MYTGISAKQFSILSDVMHHLDRAPASERANRRRAKRSDVRATFSAVLVDVDQHPQVRIYTRNFSTSGIGFVSRRQFKIGERFAIAIRIPQSERKILVGKVTFARYVRNGMYEMGAEFHQAMLESQASVMLRRVVGD